jgi:hypothetical protein
MDERLIILLAFFCYKNRQDAGFPLASPYSALESGDAEV